MQYKTNNELRHASGPVQSYLSTRYINTPAHNILGSPTLKPWSNFCVSHLWNVATSSWIKLGFFDPTVKLRCWDETSFCVQIENWLESYEQWWGGERYLGIMTSRLRYGWTDGLKKPNFILLILLIVPKFEWLLCLFFVSMLNSYAYVNSKCFYNSYL